MSRPLSLAVLLATTAAGAAEPARSADRWFYASYNLQVEKNADALIELIGRAGKAGYNGVVLADYKFNIPDRVPKHYFANARRVKAAADAAGVEVIPVVFPVGYSSGLLAHDPNLAEGPPVIDAPFVVRGREAVPDPAARPKFVNGGLEDVKGDRFAGFGFQDDPGTVTFADRAVGRMENPRASSTGNCRITQKVTLRPHAAYRFSGWVKTHDLKPADFQLLALGKGRALTHHESRLKPTQDWAEVSVAFNTLGETDVTLYAGFWGGGSGTLWLDDFALEELGPVNVLRRPGCPFTVRAADGGITYEEGKDYQPVRDPKLGQVPYAGEYEFGHPAPSLRLTAESRIKEGDRLRVSWYHPVLVHGDQVACCLTEAKVYELLADQARRVNDLWKPRTVFMAHDELRVAGWCKACEQAGRTPGELLAADVRRCVSILNHVSPQARVVVWSDMFDPNHNARDNYYLVNGSLRGSWEGLPKSVTVANWNRGKSATSLRWFADRGHPQVMASYYDRAVPDLPEWEAAAKGLPGVTGFMFTTWHGDYGRLEQFGKLMAGRRE